MKNYMYIIVATMALSFEYLLIKASAGASPFLTGMMIFSVAGILLAAGAGKQQKVVDYKRCLPWAVLVGVIGSCCNFLWIYGTRLTTVANASSLGRLDVVFTLLMSAFLFREKIPLKMWPCIVLSLAGAAVVSCSGADLSCSVNAGDWMVVGAALMLSLNSFIIKRFSGSFGPMRLAAVNCGINVIFFSLAWLLSGNAAEILSLPLATWIMLILCGICSFLFFFGYYSGVRELPVWEVRLIALSAPVITTVGGYMFLNETVNLYEFAGILMLLAGSCGIVLSGIVKQVIRHDIIIQGAD
tara:strand:+ start:74 stop:970 length:897 start_codon:yes stop_codon:yes gene_type:complete